VELLYRAKLSGLGIKSMPITWHHQEDSKISLLSDSFKMFWETIKIAARLNIEYFITSPLRNWKGKAGQDAPIFRLLFVLLASVLLFLMPMVSSDYGITGDELAQKTYGEFILKHYQTDGKFVAEDGKFKGENALNMQPNLYYYGGLFDYTAAWVNEKLGGGRDEYDVRHFLNALFGFILILFTGFLAREISGSWTVGFLALLFMAVSPRIFGHSMNNPKDIPFAAAFAFTLLYIIRFVKELPRPGTKTIVMLILGVAAAINVRVGGILLIAYLGLFTGLAYLLQSDLRSKLTDVKHLGKIILKGLLVAVLGYMGGLFFWPWGAQAPLKNPLEALREMSNFSTSIRMLFEGQHLWSDELPWYYIPKYLLIASPVVVLLGAVLFLVFLLINFKNKKTLPALLLAFAGIFPVAYAILKHSSLYDGMRHFLFVYPMLAALAAYGWYQLANWKAMPALNYGTAGATALLCAMPAFWMVKNHPYQYVYFNELSGGAKHAYLNYEMDYWMTSTKNMSTWLVNNEERIKKGEEVLVATNCYDPVKHYMAQLAPKVKVVYARYYDRQKVPADYYMFIPRFVENGHMASGSFPPAEVVYEEKVDGALIGAISKRAAPYEKEASDAETAKNYAEAIRLYDMETKARPKNEAAWMGLIRCYQAQQDFPNMKRALDAVLPLAENYNSTHFYYGIYYMNTGDQANAKASFEKTVDVNYKNSAAYYYLASIYGQEGDADKVVEAIEMYDKTGGNVAQAYDMGINAANSTGNTLLNLYFQAKKAYFNKDYQNSFNLVKQALGADPDYKPALDLNKVYEASQSQQGK
jgi:tetratricopeptide (TPR) repeat protein